MKNTSSGEWRQPISGLPAAKIKWLSVRHCEHGHTFLEHYRCYRPEEYREPKFLLFDLETTTHKGEYFGQNWQTSIAKTTEYGKILAYSYRWLGGKTIVRGWIDFKGGDREKQLVQELWKLIDRSDYVIAHNGKNFDIRWFNTRMRYHGFMPPSPSKMIDTQREAKKYLRLPSYSLDAIADYFGFPRKIRHEGLEMWDGCIALKRKWWKKMKLYAGRDVDILEKVFNMLRPFGKI